VTDLAVGDRMRKATSGGGAQQRSSRLYGVLVTFRRPAELRDTLHRLADQARRLDHLVVVDNAPVPENEAVLDGYRATGGEADYLPAPENLGPAGGIALGMEHVLRLAGDADWVVTLDDDDPPADPGQLARLETFAHRMAETDPRVGAVGLVGARLDPRRGRLRRLADHELRSAVTVDYVGGDHFPFVKVGAIREVGPFRKELFFGFDDLDFCIRLKRAGYRIYVDGDAGAVRRASLHRMGIEKRPDVRLGEPSWRRYYSLRNMIVILRSHGRWPAAMRLTMVAGIGKPLANLVRTPRQAVRHLRLNLRACRDGWTGRLGRRVEPERPPG
jgi:GT2 family glycosyltransferase